LSHKEFTSNQIDLAAQKHPDSIANSGDGRTIERSIISLI